MITDVFGIPVRYEAWDKQNFLPFYIAASYKFHIAYIDDKRCLMLTPTDSLASIPALKKQLLQIWKLENLPVFFDLASISYHRRKSFIENKIPFVTPKQVYLPFVGMSLSNETEFTPQIKKFVFSTQQLFLLYLYNRKKQLYISEATKILPFTAMTLSRAVKQLEATNLFSITKDGVNNVLTSNYTRWELFESAKTYLSTPIRKSGYIYKSQITADMVLAGETALSENTMLNPNRMTTYAIDQKLFPKNTLSTELLDPESQCHLELWSYNPKLFATENIADPLSVILSFSENVDERIEQAIEDLKESELRN